VNGSGRAVVPVPHGPPVPARIEVLENDEEARADDCHKTEGKP